MQIWFLSNGSYSLKNCHNPFGKAIQPPPPYGKIPVEHWKSLRGASLSTKRLNLIARGRENRKSDCVTFMLDAFLDSTSWTLRSTKRVGLLFSVFTLDFPMKKSISLANLSHVLPLKRWYPEQHIDRHTIAFCKIRNGIHWFIPQVKLFQKRKVFLAS